MENEIEINGTTYVRKDSVQQTPTNKDGLPYVICRGYYCGVHAGYPGYGDGYGYGPGNGDGCSK